jgi:hypothetical protein
MAVYVDKSIWKFKNMIMCHLLADTISELHDMADKIGMDRKWFQSTSKTPHYDICTSKRALAVNFGATEISRKQTVAIIRKLREQSTIQTNK